ncbi:MAG: hypothetical protein R3D69_05245 [Xanthobacteraceae bacterium]
MSTTESNGASRANVSDQVQQGGKEAKTIVNDALSSVSETARDKLGELGTAAKESASQASDQVKEKLGTQKEAGAAYASRFAENIRASAKAFESDTPIAAQTINAAADYVESAAEKLRNGSFNDAVEGMTTFARRQPAAFLGLSVLAGFAAIRFLKASGSGSNRSGDVS